MIKNRKRKLMQGRFIPRNPEKYRGDPSGIIYRSSWEYKFCNYLDRNTTVIEWASEEFSIPYLDPARKLRKRRYFPDFWFVALKKGIKKTYVIEVKPFKETKPPTPPKRVTEKSKKRLINESLTYATNEAKWQAAREFCMSKGWEFKIITEHELGIATK